MNYVWELAIRAIESGISLDAIAFIDAECFSPYMELSFPYINQTSVPSQIEMNPYYRYYSVFKELLHPDMDENPQLVDAIFDSAIHNFIDVDILMGMNRREYSISFVIHDLMKGYFGSYIQDRLYVFSEYEKKVLANSILDLYATGECIHLLKRTMGQIFKNTYIFSNAKERDEIIFFLRIPYSKEADMKISVMKYLFLPFKCTVEIYYENIFGVMGVDELMKIGQMVLY